MKLLKSASFVGCSGTVLLAGASIAQIATQAVSSDRLEEIIVTAQKREENEQNIGMSIQAASYDALTDLGIKNVSDLEKITPGLYYAPGLNGAPQFTIRGVGYLDPSIAANPTVSVYTDEIPLPFSIMAEGATLDLQRLEVLKGPQGTLFGENATGGAINYVANKPTSTFQAGTIVSYGRFNRYDIEAYASGPLASSLEARVAVRTQQGDGYQQSYTHEATIGSQNFTDARLSFLWTPLDELKVLATASAFYDRSQSAAFQFYGIHNLSNNTPLPPGLITYPVAPLNDRAADWSTCVNNTPLDTGCAGYHVDNRFYMASLRADYDIGHDLTVSLLSAYERFRQYQPLDPDGTTYEDYETINTGHLDTVFEELRLAGRFAGKGNWIAGGNWEYDDTAQDTYASFFQSSAGTIFGFPLVGTNPSDDVKIHTFAGFGHADYSIIDAVSLEGGLRYTVSNQSFAGCQRDNGNGNFSTLTQILQNFFTTGTPAGAGINAGPGGCATLIGAGLVPGLVHSDLDQHNISWRGGVNWQLDPDVLLYANASQGFKAGSFSNLSASRDFQYQPAVQEKLLAYETGFKTTLFDRTLQLNGAAYYYKYDNKQIQGSVPDPFYGDLPKLINIPKSHVVGGELSAIWKPMGGLTITPVVSYLRSRIDGNFSTYNYLGELQNMTGESFPAAPSLQADVDGEYSWGLHNELRAFVGANVSYTARENSLLGNFPIVDNDAYTLVDLRAGLNRDRWRVELWGRNVLDKYYTPSKLHINDVYVRFPGQPATFGITASYRYQ